MIRLSLKSIARLLVPAAMLIMTAPCFGIVNGTPDDGVKPKFPNVGAIVARKQPGNFPPLDRLPQTISTGTLVHPRVLLTAGHTVAFMQHLMSDEGGLTLKDFGVSFEYDAHDAQSQTYVGVESIMTHEQFFAFLGLRSPVVALDVGVIILERPVDAELVKLACDGFLDEQQLIRGETPFLVVGYGATLEDGFPPPLTGALVLPSGERHWAFSTFGVLQENYLFLSQKLARGEGGSSNGDSGGPAFLLNDAGELVQVGIYSSGDDVSVSLGVFTRTDLDAVRDFVGMVAMCVEGD